MHEEIVAWSIKTLLKIGLVDKGWTFVIEKTHSRILGQCDYGRKRIILRGVHRDDWRDIILHEIAHALVYEVKGTMRPDGEGPHGPTFIAMCALLKCDARPSRSGDLITADNLLAS